MTFVIHTRNGYVKDWRLSKLTNRRDMAEKFSDRAEAERVSKSLFYDAPVETNPCERLPNHLNSD